MPGWLLPCMLLIGCAPHVSVPPMQPPELLIVGSTYATPPDPPQPLAIRVRDGVVQEVLSPDVALATINPATTVLYADRVTPGFVDAHAHPALLARYFNAVDLGHYNVHQDQGDSWVNAAWTVHAQVLEGLIG